MNTIDSEHPYFFLAGGGEMGRLTRQFDWSNTTLGSPDGWPQSLRTTLSILLNSKFPMFLFWGPELLCFYNDAYRPSLGSQHKHPFALGRAGAQVWPEIWPIIKPQIDQVVTHGEATWHENSVGSFFRNGQLEAGFWTYSYSPVRDEQGQVAGVFVTCIETTKSVIHEKQLEASESRLRMIIEDSVVAMAIFHGPQFTVDMANEAHLALWARRAEEVIGQPLFTVIPELQDQGFKALLENVVGSGEPFYAKEFSVRLRRKGRLEQVHVNIVCHPLRNADGQVYGVLVTAVDMTDQVLARLELEQSEARYRSLSEELDSQVDQRTQELQLANQELQRSNESLQRFAYVASHDLQEPLRKILQFGDLLQVNQADSFPMRDDYLTRMRSAATRMSILIRDLLTYSRLSNNQPRFQAVSISKVVSDVIELLDLVVTESGAAVLVEPLPTIQGDPVQLGQLFQNLLGNALKFRQKDVAPQIHIRHQLVSAQTLPSTLQLSKPADTVHQIDVTDNGIGFDEKYLDRIFNMFQRLHGKSEFTGTGIGLAICEKVVANHGGAITASSKPGQGSTFKLFFPLYRS